MSAASDKSPLALSDAELQQEADQLALRIAHSSLHIRDAGLVIELANRLIRNSAPKNAATNYMKLAMGAEQ